MLRYPVINLAQAKPSAANLQPSVNLKSRFSAHTRNFPNKIPEIFGKYKLQLVFS